MDSLHTMSAVIYQLPMLLLAITWPPMVTGAFWVTVGVFALVSVFFDDETPRGNPGIDYEELAKRANREPAALKSARNSYGGASHRRRS